MTPLDTAPGQDIPPLDVPPDCVLLRGADSERDLDPRGIRRLLLLMAQNRDDADTLFLATVERHGSTLVNDAGTWCAVYGIEAASTSGLAELRANWTRRAADCLVPA